MGEMDLHEQGCRETAESLQTRDRQKQSGKDIYSQSMSDIPPQQAAGRFWWW